MRNILVGQHMTNITINYFKLDIAINRQIEIEKLFDVKKISFQKLDT